MENDMIVKLRKPFYWEGIEYTEIDLSGLESLTGEDLLKLSKSLGKSTSVSGVLLPEMDYEGGFILAAQATGLPIEFFKALPIKDASLVRTKVVYFFNN